MHRLVLLALVFIFPVVASAHVTVRPSEVGVAAYQTFNVSVPTEKDVDTVGIRLIIPEGLESMRPNVKPGWDIEIVKVGEGEAARVTEIIWTGGSIPADQRDDFFFSARTPASASTLIWKAYQTYADESVVAWDASDEAQPHNASDEPDFSEVGPYSQTMVINDLEEEEEVPVVVETVTAAPSVPAEKDPMWWDTAILLAIIMSGVSLILAIKASIRRIPTPPSIS